MSFTQGYLWDYHEVLHYNGYSQTPHKQPAAACVSPSDGYGSNMPLHTTPTNQRDLYADMTESSIQQLKSHIASNGGTNDALQSSPEIQEMTLDVMLSLSDMGKYPEGGLRDVFPNMRAKKDTTFWDNILKDETEVETPRAQLPELRHTLSLWNTPQKDRGYGKDVKFATGNGFSLVRTSPMRGESPFSTGRSSIVHSIGQHQPTVQYTRYPLAEGGKYKSPQKGRPGKFRTSYQKSGAPRPSRQLAISLGYRGVHKYQGDPKTVIQNATCPEDMNCAIWMSQIPTWVTTKDIFATITEGKVWSFYKVGPIPGRFEKCGAKIVFQERHIAEQYLNKCHAGVVMFGDNFVKVQWNRNPIYPCTPEELGSSRVLRIYGRDPQIKCEDLVALLNNEMEFELQEENVYMDYNTLTTAIELVFDKVVGQSRQAMALIKDIARTNGYDWKVEYGPDPCDQVNYAQQMVSGTQVQTRIAQA